MMDEPTLYFSFALTELGTTEKKGAGDVAIPAVINDEVVSLESLFEFVRSEYNMEGDFAILTGNRELRDDETIKLVVNEALDSEVDTVALDIIPFNNDWELIERASQHNTEDSSSENGLSASPELKETTQDEAEVAKETTQVETEVAIQDGLTASDSEVVSCASATVVQIKSHVKDENASDEVECAEEPIEQTETATAVEKPEEKCEGKSDEKPEEHCEGKSDEKPEEPEHTGQNNVSRPEESPEPQYDLSALRIPTPQEFFGEEGLAEVMRIVDEEQSSVRSLQSFSLPGSTIVTPSPLDTESFGMIEEKIEPKKYDELVETLCELAKKALNNHPEAALKDLECFVKTHGPSAPMLKLASDQRVVDSVLKALSSPAVRNFIVDLARNEVASFEAFREILKSHLGELFGGFGGLLHEHPGLVAVIPELLRGLTAVLERSNHSTSVNTEAEQDVEKPIHYGILCDGCDREERKDVSISQGNNYGEHIRGVRYKSAIKVNFDLCESCESSGLFDEEFAPFLKIKVPEKAPRDIVCVLKERTNAEQHTSEVQQPENAAPVPERGNYPAERDTTTSHTSSMQLTCPKNEQHQLMQFTVPNRRFACDVCNTRPQRGETMYGCRICDWDVCSSCSANEFRYLRANEEEPNSNNADMRMLPRAKFVGDINYLDCSLLKPGTRFKKIWRVRNSSNTVAWQPGCRVICVGGSRMGSALSGNLVPPLPPGETGDVSVDMVSPTKPGRYIGYWRLVTPDNHQFGQRFWIDITVSESAESTETPSSVPATTQKWCKELQHLADMDFLDCEYNVQLLDKYNGSLDLVISTLLEQD